jgi:molecular chaperone DnaJ
VLGGEMPIETPYGADTLRVQAATAADKVVKIANAGVPRLRGTGRGDLYLHLRVTVPQKLSAEQADLVRRLMDLDVASGDLPEQSEGFLAKVFGSDKNKNRNKKKR